MIGCANYMFVLGTLLLIGSIQPYFASYFRVSANTTQILFPTILVINTLIIPFGGQLAHKIRPRILIAIAGSILVCCLVLSSLADRDQFIRFYILYSVGYGVCGGLSFMIPLKLAWKSFPNQPGLASGIVVSGTGLSLLVFYQLSRLLANPDNLAQTETTVDKAGQVIYVYPDEVSLRVPFMLQTLTAIYACLIVVTLFLIGKQKAKNSDNDFS